MNIREEILPAMILAPSAHNTQPWKFRIEDNVLDVLVDPKRHLEVSDPTMRQTYISLGCAIMNAIVAAAHQGKVVEIKYLPDVDIAARLIFTEGSPNEHLAKLFSAIDMRRTNRTLYDSKPLTVEEQGMIKSDFDSDANLISDRQKISDIANLVQQGTERTLSRQDFKAELSGWVRNNWTKQPDGMPGYAMGMPALMSLVAAPMVKIMPIHKQEGPKSKKEVESASALVVIATEEDDKTSWLKAGQLLEQAWLEATIAGLAAMPVTAPIEASQEVRRKLQEAVGTEKNIQTILRVGHSSKKDLRSTPRRSVADCTA